MHSCDGSDWEERPIAGIEVWIANLADIDWRHLLGADFDNPAVQSAAGKLLVALKLGDDAFGTRPSPISNISHSGCHLVLASTCDPLVEALGVDVEVRRRIPRERAFAHRILARNEVANDLVGAWTAKEAALKAVGVGLSGDPRSWEFQDLDCATPRLIRAPLHARAVERWTFVRLEIAGFQPATLTVAARLARPGQMSIVLKDANAPDTAD